MSVHIPEELRKAIPPLRQGAILVEDAETRHRYLMLEIEPANGLDEMRPIPLDCLSGLIAQLAEPPDGDDWPLLSSEAAVRAWGDDDADSPEARTP